MINKNLGTAIIIINDKRELLLGKRKNSYKARYYGIPGGKLNIGEDIYDCAKRELIEETAIKPLDLNYLTFVKEYQAENKIDYIHFIFLCTKWHGNIKLTEPDKCEKWLWYKPSLIKTIDKILPGHYEGINYYLNEDKQNKEYVEI